MAIDILQTTFTVPETTYILAPGWEGRNYFNKIPHDAFVITVNYGVEIPRVQKHLWMAEDKKLPDYYSWFREATREYINKCYMLHEPWPTPVFDSGYLYQLYPNVPYIYKSGPPLANRLPTFKTGSREAQLVAQGHKVNPAMASYDIIPGVLRGRATISSKAIQLAVQKGAKRIILVGVDMRGKKYFDERETRSGHIPKTSIDGRWAFVPHFNMLIKNLSGKGVEIVSLSPTALNVEMVG